MRLNRVCLSMVIVVLLATGCQKSEPEDDPGQLHVVTTVAPITNIVYNVTGHDVSLHGLIPEGTDSHTFEPAPSDAAILSKAGLVFVNGLHLETPTENLAEKSVRSGVEIYRLGDHTITEQEWIYDFSFPKDKGNPNPHLWMNVANARQYAVLAAEKLRSIDPAHKDRYIANLRRYTVVLDQLDAAIKTAVATIPAEHRKLVTYHDSFAYFAPRYGMQVIGAVQPADFKEPSGQDIASIIDQLKTEKVPAIFGSEVFPSKVIDQIGREANVKYVTTLRDDDLPGKAGEAQHTYVGMMLEDVRTIVTSLGGTPDALNAIKPDNTCEP